MRPHVSHEREEVSQTIKHIISWFIYNRSCFKSVKIFSIMLNFVSSLFSQTFLSRSKANCQDLLRPFSDPPHLTPTEWVRICHIPVSRYQSRKSAVSQSIWTWCDRREGGVRGGRLAVTAISILLSAELSFFFFDSTLSQTKKKKERNFSSIFSLPLLNHFCCLKEF